MAAALAELQVDGRTARVRCQGTFGLLVFRNAREATTHRPTNARTGASAKQDKILSCDSGIRFQPVPWKPSRKPTWTFPFRA